MRKPPDPMTASQRTLQNKVAKVCQLFEENVGEIDHPTTADPLASLVETLLSHNTNDRNRDIAFKNLLETYPDWEAVHHAPHEELAQVVRVAGLNRQKAKRIQELLAYVKETHGEYTADFLREMTFEEAVEELGHLKGMGFKTIAVVMCFTLGVDVFPVDTHVHRLSKRIGFVPEKYDAVKTFKAMRPLVPEGKSYQFHLHLITHGRQVCHARKPKCEECFVREHCLYYFQNNRN
ncbi:endonuclease III [bacterium]|nr:endonuclease III [bacterium]